MYSNLSRLLYSFDFLSYYVATAVAHAPMQSSLYLNLCILPIALLPREALRFYSCILCKTSNFTNRFSDIFKIKKNVDIFSLLWVLTSGADICAIKHIDLKQTGAWQVLLYEMSPRWEWKPFLWTAKRTSIPAKSFEREYNWMLTVQRTNSLLNRST